MPRSLHCLTVLLVLTGVANLFAGDWPQWRYDAGRSNASPHELPSMLELAWSRHLPALEPAWPDQPKMQLDAIYEPVVAGQRLFVGSSHFDTLTAYDTRSGAELWRFHAEGPLRFAPACWEDKVYFASDDGYLYCLAADSGRLIWKFRGGPRDRKILGNQRLISTWPARGAPVVADGKVYFAAGIWPFMGTFLHALDARTGEVVWTNDGDGSLYIKQPHNSDSFAGVAPQGPLVVSGDTLLIPGGRSVPAAYDRLTGQFRYYELAENGKRGGGSAVAASKELFINGGATFDVGAGKYLGAAGELVVIDADSLYQYRDGDLQHIDLKASRVEVVDTVDRKGAKTKTAKWSVKEVAEASVPKLAALIKSGSRLYAVSDNRVMALSLPLQDKKEAEVTWQSEVEGMPATLVAGDNRLFVVTREGAVHCFAAKEEASAKATPVVHAWSPKEPLPNTKWAAKATSLLQSSGVKDGYAIVWGVGTGDMALELARQSNLRLIVLDPDERKAHAFRDRLFEHGITGSRIAVYHADPLKVELPPYLASVITAEELPRAALQQPQEFLKRIYEVLRPYGGQLCLDSTVADHRVLWESASQLSLANGASEQRGEWFVLAREGALPGAANWTHEHADASNTRVSRDSRVKAPLGLLWFGGPSNDGILPRHGHGPQPQVVDGRLFIEGVHIMRANDIYTGRLLWERSLPNVGAFYDNTQHQPGANAAGTNFIATPDGLYVAYDRKCLRLDPATGETMQEFQLPPMDGQSEPPRWGYISVEGDYLVGGAEPLFDEELTRQFVKASKPLATDAATSTKPQGSASGSIESSIKELLAKLSRGDNDNHSSSRRLTVMNRHTGQVLWSADARNGFRHNGVCIGGGRLYAIDRLSGTQLTRLKRRGERPAHPPRLVVFDLATGLELWSSEEEIFGTWLSYSQEHDVLVEAGFAQRDSLSDEPRGMRAWRASSGERLWENKVYAGPAMLHGRTILMAGSGCDLLTGEQKMREHPLTGEEVPWSWSRNYGCNTPIASEHLLTFRSGAAGYFDLCNDGGTGNMGGFRSSCTNNLVVAGGLLNAPDYTRTCTCNYQNQTSLALIHMPEAEMWTSFLAAASEKPIRQLGINLSAPGDRRDDDGTLWLEFPSAGSTSPNVSVRVEPQDVQWFRRHSSQVTGEGPAWVTSSGGAGIERLVIGLAKTKTVRRYTVRLYFVEPDEVQPGQRVFDVALQGQTVLENFDVRAAAGGRHRGVVREFTGVEAGDELRLEMKPSRSATMQQAVLCGIELEAEGW